MNLTEPTGKATWQTPQDVLHLVRKALGIYAFDCDPATSAANPTGARAFYTPEEDGLSQSWDGWVWLNPPWSKATPIDPWVARFAAHQTGTMLVPVSANARWFHRVTDGAALALFPKRVNFVDPTTGLVVKGCPFDSALVCRGWSAEALARLSDAGLRVLRS